MLAYGTYTPTVSGVSNVATVFASQCQWMRIGNIVTVSGALQMNLTLSTTNTEISISLPVASTFTDSAQCAGAGAFLYFTAGAALVIGVGALAHLLFTSQSTAQHTVWFTFTYQIL